MRYDVVVAGGGHNGLVAAAYLAKAGRSVLVLERQDHVGGLAVSARPFPGVDARLSRYSYLVSLLPGRIREELGLRLELRRRRFASYTPAGETGLLVDNDDAGRTAESFAAVTGGHADLDAWRRFYGMIGEVARRLAPTLLEPLPTRDEARRIVGDDEAWRVLFERPIGETVDEWFGSDVVRGVVLTDALIGTFADPARDMLANRCFLYHVIGDGRGDWNVPVGGMGAVSRSIADVAVRHGAEIRTGAEVVAIDPEAGEVTFRDEAGEHAVTGGHVLAALPPAVLARLTGGPETPAPEGAQLKVNLVLARLPRLKDPRVDPAEAFSGTFHINEGRDQLAAAYAQAAAGRIPELPPAEVYCHTLTDPSILGPGAAGVGRAHDDAVRAAHARAAVPRRPGRRAGAGAAGHARLDRLGARRADRGLPAARAGRRAVPGGEDAGRPGGRVGAARRAHLPPRSRLAVRGAGRRLPRRRRHARRALGRGDRVAAGPAVRGGGAARRRGERHPRPQRGDGAAQLNARRNAGRTVSPETGGGVSREPRHPTSDHNSDI